MSLKNVNDGDTTIESFALKTAPKPWQTQWW